MQRTGTEDDWEARTDDPRQLLTSGNVRNASKEVRLGFVRKVYGILTAQLLLTVAIAAPLQLVESSWLSDHEWLLYLSIGCMVACLCSMACCAHVARQFPTNYIFLFAFTAFMGVMVGFASARYTWQSVVLAAGITVLIFALLTIFAWTTKTDFTGFGPYLYGFMFALFAFGIVMMIMGMCGIHVQWLVMIYDGLGVLLFTFYIVFDTQLIIGEYGGHQTQFGVDDFAFASLNLYLDIINLFLHILSLIGKRRN